MTFFSRPYIKIGYFSSDTELVYQDEVHGSLLNQAEYTVDLIYTKYLKGIVSYEGIARIETYPYPREAIREAVLNAIAHKNYATLIPIQIKIFDDKMIISNDSVFPEDWTIEDFLGKHRSRPYNPLIANTFYRAGFIESWGRGIQKINETCRTAGNKEPVFQIKKDEMTVIFEANTNSGNDTVNNVLNLMSERSLTVTELRSKLQSLEKGVLSEEEKIRIEEVLHYLIKNNYINGKSAAELLHVSSPTARRLLIKAVNCEILSCAGTTSAKQYYPYGKR